MDTKVTSDFGDEYAYENSSYVQGILMNAYTNIPTRRDHYDNNFLDVATDNAVTNDYSSNMYALGGGMMSASTNVIGVWDLAYESMAYIHLFMEKNMDTANVVYYQGTYEVNRDSMLRYRLQGEAYFLRAYWGMELLKVYGGESEDGEMLGYPIITEYFTTDQQDSVLENIGRNTYEECVQQILDDCDSAIFYLPMEYTGTDDDGILGSEQIGRASAAAAYVLKSRVATYAASPAFNLEGDVSKWERAAQLSQEAIDSVGLTYYALSYTDVTNPTTTTTPDDYVFRKYFNNNTSEGYNLPPAYYGEGRTQPSQNLVDAFYDSQGYPITHTNSIYDPQNPYDNRDPRLTNTVIYNGINVEESGRDTEVASYIIEYVYSYDTISTADDGFGNTVYEIDSTATLVERIGYDGPGYYYNNTRTGYYLRKWISTIDDMLDLNDSQTDDHLSPILRGIEAYHNLAEASFEATGSFTGVVSGCSLSAYDIIGQIRSKNLNISSDPYLDELTTEDEIRTEIHNERRLDFAFEDHRYFDLRRWMDYDKMNEPIYGMTLTSEYGADTYVGTDPNGTKVTVEERAFDNEKYYYNPLPYDEVAKSDAIVQNKGW
jgi:hypothetical protein